MKTNNTLCARTVTGLIDIGSLGVTLPHEHIMADAHQLFFHEPAYLEDKSMAYAPVTLENLYWVRAHPLSNLDCLKMPDETILLKELLAFKKAGGNTIVDVSTRPLGGADPLTLRRLARNTGLNIIMGTGYYQGLLYLPEVSSLTEDALCRGMVDDLTRGIGDSGVCAGIIGEIGLTPGLREDEIRLLRACSSVQRQTGAPLTIHPPGLNRELIQKILQILGDNGGNPARTVICHVDIMGLDLDVIRFIASSGCYVEFDTFGHLFPPVLIGGNMMGFPNENQRINAIKQLIKEGYVPGILL